MSIFNWILLVSAAVLPTVLIALGFSLGIPLTCPGPFDGFLHGCTAWMCCCTFYYGPLLGLTSSFVLMTVLEAQRQNKNYFKYLRFAVVGVLVIAISSANQNRNFDWLVYRLGYQIFLLARPTVLAVEKFPKDDFLVIPPRHCLEVRNGAERLCVTTSDGSLRAIIWDGGKGVINVQLDKSRRFLTKKGNWTGFDWKEKGGISRCWYEEENLRFDDLPTAEATVKCLTQGENVVCDEDGLVVSWMVSSKSNCVSISVRQVFIGWYKPKGFKCGENAKIRTIRMERTS